jgi:fatty-acyl-CoA synthase
MPSRLQLIVRLGSALPGLIRGRPEGSYVVADRVEELARERPGQPFVLYEDRKVSYAENNARANRVAGWAQSMGLGRGDKVALLMENRPEYLSSWAGLAKLGVTAALINTNLNGRALTHAIGAAEARFLILGAECIDRYATAADELSAGNLQVWVSREAGDDTPRPDGAHDLDAALAEYSDANPDPSARAGMKGKDGLFYIYTSGTTGLPKAARFSNNKFVTIGFAGNIGCGLRPGDVHYCALPLYHSAGGAMQVSAVMSSGATLALRKRFSASAFWDDVRRYNASHFQYIGEFCRYLLNQPPRDDDRDHRIRLAIGNGLRPDIWEEFQSRFGIDEIVEFYGATEGNTFFANFDGKVGSVGRPPAKFMSNARLLRYDVDADTHIRDEKGLCIECDPDEPGELVGQINDGLGRFEGYTSKEATDKKVLRDVFESGDAWFRTGDLLRHDQEGYYYFVDRIGDTFRWKGENVSTQEVAEILSAFPGMETINVYGVEVAGQDGRAGMAGVNLAQGIEFDPAAFHAHATGSLPSYAVPIFVRLVGADDLTGTFKLRKVDLKQEGYDLTKIQDPLFVRDSEQATYVPLSAEIAGEIDAGRRRL